MNEDILNHEDTKTRRREELARIVVDAAFKVHSALGPGLLENVYEICLVHELHRRGLQLQRQLVVPIEYDGIKLDAGLRLDLLIEDELIVELKAVEELHAIHTAQLLTYLKLTRRKLGLLINFNVLVIKNGIRRVIL